MFNFVCACYWETNHPVRSFDWLDFTQNLIRLTCSIFSRFAVWLFILCGRLLVMQNRAIMEKVMTNKIKLNNSVSSSTMGVMKNDEIWSILSGFQLLLGANRTLHRQFRTILLANCILSVVIFLTSSYYVILYCPMGLKFLPATIWDASDILESAIRLWFVCDTADLIRSSVKSAIDFALLHIFNEIFFIYCFIQ